MSVDTTTFLAAARILQGDRSVRSAKAMGLLEWLGLSDEDGQCGDHSSDAQLLATASTFTSFFHIPVSAAPGLIALGAVVDLDKTAACPGIGSVGVSGVGTTPCDAFRACVGEGLEALCSVEMADDVACQIAAPTPLSPETIAWIDLIDRKSEAMSGAWTPVSRMRDHSRAYLPTDTLLRRPPARRSIELPWPFSVGCGAGTTLEKAYLHGLCEVVERDAIALWWRGGRRGKALPKDSFASESAFELLNTLRRDNPKNRQTFLLDITTDLGIPTVVVVSFGSDGNGFCCGIASRPTLARAAHGALLEMCQMEVAYDVVQMKRSTLGDEALNLADRAHLSRYHGIALGRCDLVHPERGVSPAVELSADSASIALEQIVTRLSVAGFDPLILDVSRPQYLAKVCHAICPGLEIEPSLIVGRRLAETIAATGGGAIHTGGISLM